MNGWIKFYRSSTNNFLYQENRASTKREAWEDILLTVNFEPKTCLIKGKAMKVGAGESLLSLDSWAKKWKWSKGKVKRFFELLQSENMLLVKNETVTTRIIVCKWDDYQMDKPQNGTQTERRRNADGTQTGYD